MTRPLRVAIAEDSAILRDGLVATAGRPWLRRHRRGGRRRIPASVRRAAICPDVAVIDIRMPPTFTDEGLRAAIELRRPHRDSGILMFSQYIETRYAAELLADDAAGIGYLLKDRVADVSDFVEALVRVASAARRWTPRWSPSSWGRRGAPTPSRC